jgi:propionate CoA-transferase
MAFRPSISEHLKAMDSRLFSPDPMGLAEDLKAAQHEARTPRRSLRNEVVNERDRPANLSSYKA